MADGRVRRARDRGRRLHHPLRRRRRLVGRADPDVAPRTGDADKRMDFATRSDVLAELEEAAKPLHAARRQPDHPRPHVGGDRDRLRSRAHVLRRRRGSGPAEGQDRGHPGIRLPGPRPRPEPQGLRRRRRRRPARGLASRSSTPRPPASRSPSIEDAASPRRHRDGAAPRREAPRRLRGVDQGRDRPRQPAACSATGSRVHYNEVEAPPEVDVALVAPKGPGHLVRRQYLEGSGVPALIAIDKNATGNAQELALAYAKGIGGTRGGVIETTFKDETETDLFGEQAVLCGGVSELVTAGYETLVDAGLRPQARVLRVPPRAQADRGPDVREGHHRDAPLDLQHGRVRRPDARQADHHRRDARRP